MTIIKLCSQLLRDKVINQSYSCSTDVEFRLLTPGAGCL